MRLQTGIDYFSNLSVFELREIVKEVSALGKEQGVRNGNKNRRRS